MSREGLWKNGGAFCDGGIGGHRAGANKKNHKGGVSTTVVAKGRDAKVNRKLGGGGGRGGGWVWGGGGGGGGGWGGGPHRFKDVATEVARDKGKIHSGGLCETQTLTSTRQRIRQTGRRRGLKVQVRKDLRLPTGGGGYQRGARRNNLKRRRGAS